MATHHPFRFGLATHRAESRQAWIEKARKAEASGFSTLLLEDHLHSQLAPFAALTAAADATTVLRVGTFVLGNDFRHPVLVAKEAATIDLLTEGRLELGLGTGWMRADYEQSGLQLESPGIRVRRFAEAVQIIKGLFGDESFTFEGSFYTVHGLNGLPKPMQKPHPPILIGGGSKRILSIAAREADIVSINIRTTADGDVDNASITAEAVDQKIAWVREAAGTRFDQLEFNILVPILVISVERRKATEQVLHQFGVSVDDASIELLLASPSALIGTVDQIAEDLQRRRERYGISYIVVWEPMEQFVPVIERLAGT